MGTWIPSEICAGKHISLMGHTHPYSDICAGKHASLGICVGKHIPMTLAVLLHGSKNGSQIRTAHRMRNAAIEL